jgi:hypothetical protein
MTSRIGCPALPGPHLLEATDAGESWPVGGRVVGSRPSAPLVMPWLLLVHHEDLAKGDRSPVARR